MRPHIPKFLHPAHQKITKHVLSQRQSTKQRLVRTLLKNDYKKAGEEFSNQEATLYFCSIKTLQSTAWQLTALCGRSRLPPRPPRRSTKFLWQGVAQPASCWHSQDQVFLLESWFNSSMDTALMYANNGKEKLD